MWLHEWRLHHCYLGERTACLIHFLAPFSRLIFFCLSLDGHHNFVWAKYMRRRHNNKQKTIQYWLERHYIWAQKKRTKFLSNLTAKQGPMTNQKKKNAENVNEARAELSSKQCDCEIAFCIDLHCSQQTIDACNPMLFSHFLCVCFSPPFGCEF